MGERLALMNGQTLQKVFVPLPGGGAAMYAASGLSYYRHSDWLGSSRLASTPTRTVYSTTAYAPFGEPYAQSGTADLSFTGQNQDTVGGSYDFLAREYAIQGRWPSPDPAGLGAVDLSNPQSMNRYAYVIGNPLAFVDPLGLKDDCGGPCTPFTEDLGGGCYLRTTYDTSGQYDMPMQSFWCGVRLPINPDDLRPDGGWRIETSCLFAGARSTR
jgi:RHS repeat-associated protein